MIILDANIEPVFFVNDDGAVTLSHRTTATTTPDSEMLDFYPEPLFIEPIDLDALDGEETDA